MVFGQWGQLTESRRLPPALVMQKERLHLDRSASQLPRRPPLPSRPSPCRSGFGVDADSVDQFMNDQHAHVQPRAVAAVPQRYGSYQASGITRAQFLQNPASMARVMRSNVFPCTFEACKRRNEWATCSVSQEHQKQTRQLAPRFGADQINRSYFHQHNEFAEMVEASNRMGIGMSGQRPG